MGFNRYAAGASRIADTGWPHLEVGQEPGRRFCASSSSTNAVTRRWIAYDAARRRLYVIGGEGFVDVVERNGDTLRRVAQVAVRDGARTGLWIADQNRLYVAVPARGTQLAEVRVFEPQN